MKKGYLLENLTWPKAKKAFEETSMVVIPVGSTEQHGPHLPLGTDFFVPREIARLLMERSNVIVTPTLPIGYAKYHTMFPGTLSLKEETLKNVLIDICEDLLKYGTTHILFIDGHGGNLNALRQCGEWLRKRCVPSAVVTWWQLAPAIDPSWQAIGHADYIETSAILALDEDLVDLDSAKLPTNKDLSPTLRMLDPHTIEFNNATVAINLLTGDITDTGDMMEFGLTGAKDYTIEPSTGTKELGKKFYEGQADYLAEFIKEFRKVSLPPIEKTGPLAKK
ncbi:MAG: creatininase family protein [Anaerolineaceae bacterium]|nr:creatininase family protein [Anaerolineaceae bacterium]